MLALAPIRVLVVDNNAEFRYALSCHLRSQSDFTVVGEVANGEAAVREAQTLTPDVILLDIEMPEMDAATCIRALKRTAPAASIIVLSIVQSGRYHEECRRAGFHGHLRKDSPVEAIFAAIRTTRRSGRPAPSGTWT